MKCRECNGEIFEIRKNVELKLYNGNIIHIDEFICLGCGFIYCDEFDINKMIVALELQKKT